MEVQFGHSIYFLLWLLIAVLIGLYAYANKKNKNRLALLTKDFVALIDDKKSKIIFYLFIAGLFF